MENNLNDLAKRVFEANKAKGFWDKERNVGELLMLTTSELGEAMEAHRKGRFAKIHLIEHLQMEGYTWKDSPVSFKSAFEEGVKDTFEDEIADAMIRLFESICFWISIPRPPKLKYNETRPLLHGKTGNTFLLD